MKKGSKEQYLAQLRHLQGPPDNQLTLRLKKAGVAASDLERIVESGSHYASLAAAELLIGWFDAEAALAPILALLTRLPTTREEGLRLLPRCGPKGLESLVERADATTDAGELIECANILVTWRVTGKRVLAVVRKATRADPSFALALVREDDPEALELLTAMLGEQEPASHGDFLNLEILVRSYRWLGGPLDTPVRDDDFRAMVLRGSKLDPLLDELYYGRPVGELLEAVHELARKGIVQPKTADAYSAYVEVAPEEPELLDPS